MAAAVGLVAAEKVVEKAAGVTVVAGQAMVATMAESEVVKMAAAWLEMVAAMDLVQVRPVMAAVGATALGKGSGETVLKMVAAVEVAVACWAARFARHNRHSRWHSCI